MNMMPNNHTTEAEAEASAAVEIQMMEASNSNSNSYNANTKRLGNEKSGANYCNSSFFSMFNGLFGFTVMAVIVTLFIVIAVFAGPDTAESVMMTASQQKLSAGSSSSVKGKGKGKAGKVPPTDMPSLSPSASPSSKPSDMPSLSLSPSASSKPSDEPSLSFSPTACAGGWRVGEKYCNTALFVCVKFTTCPALAAYGDDIGEFEDYLTVYTAPIYFLESPTSPTVIFVYFDSGSGFCGPLTETFTVASDGNSFFAADYFDSTFTIVT
jgi:hypothetical protein